jgi:hypothetical protein
MFQSTKKPDSQFFDIRQIGRFFAYWVVVYFGQFFLNNSSSANVLATFFHGMYKLSITFDKNGLGYTLGDLFHNHIWSP